MDGTAEFGTEATGRYGGITSHLRAPRPGLEATEVIRVPCREFNGVLDDVLARESTIDVLKLDVEGLERELVPSLRPDLLARVRVVYFDAGEADFQPPPGFVHSY